MRIAIDARELAGKPTGVGRYLSEILAGWNDLAGAASHEFILCSPAAIDAPRVANLRLSTSIAAGDGTLWEQLTLPGLLKRAGADVLFAPGYTGPVLSRVPMVVTIHDVSFTAHPEWFSWREGARRRAVTWLSARRASRIVTVSDFSKREIIAHLGIDPARIEVIYSGARPASPKPQGEGGGSGIRGQGSGIGEQEEPLVLYVGSIFNRRHVPELIDAFATLAKRHPRVRLQIVGDNRSTPRIDLEALVAASGQSERIEVRSFVTDGELAELYSRASAFAFLSEYEGFGLTPLDALASGVPIVVLDTEVAREIYGPSAVYVPFHQPNEIDAGVVAEALESALFNERERARLHEASGATLQRYSWRECAQRTLQVLVASAAR